MRHVRLAGLLLAVLIVLTFAPAVSAHPVFGLAESPDLLTPACADGCPPGPRPTMIRSAEILR